MSEEALDIASLVDFPIRKGSVLVASEGYFDTDQMPFVMNELQRVAGHEEFAVMVVPNGMSVKVYGTEEFREYVYQLVREAQDAASQEDPGRTE